MKRFISLLLAAVMVLSLTACGNTAETTTVAPETTTEAVVETTAAVVEGAVVTFFSMSLGENYENIKSITAFADEDGSIYVEYVGDVKKVGNLDASIMNDVTAAMAQTDLASLNGQDAWGEGEANGSIYVEYADGTMLSVGFSGEIPAAYTDGYAIMDACFAALTADLEVYVAQPMVMGEVDADLLAEMNAILSGSGIQNLDAFAIGQVAKDEYFAYTVGLTSDAGIYSAANCTPMMMTTAYSLVIVTLQDGVAAFDICDSFEANLDWTKWVCVAPTDAMIATKGDMVLCLMAANETFTQTAAGITAAGWTTVNTLTNPMQ